MQIFNENKQVLLFNKSHPWIEFEKGMKDEESMHMHHCSTNTQLRSEIKKIDLNFNRILIPSICRCEYSCCYTNYNISPFLNMNHSKLGSIKNPTSCFIRKTTLTHIRTRDS